MTRRERRRRFSQWLSEWFQSKEAEPERRAILVEPLEQRQLLAGDVFAGLLGSSYADTGMDALGGAESGGLTAEGELVGEGEDAVDLVAFAQALTDSGTRFFGAAWCAFCTEQKQLFQDGAQFLPFIEVTNPDRSPNQIATDENITEYPTWEFPDSSRLTGLQSLETLAQRAGITMPMSSNPSLVDLPDVDVEVGSPLHVPIDAYDPNGNPLTITVSSSDPSVISAQVLTGNRSLRLSTSSFGDMVFELFEDRAPVPSGRVIELAEDGFYDGISFHRIINNFVIQGGDPTGTGAGGSTLGNFDDQFHLDLQHNRTGVLSYAKSTDDTNDSQFFITEGPQRFLDFNHSVFGQLVEGEYVREAISNTATNSSNRPLNAVTIQSADIFNDTENGMLLLRATGVSGTATITVTVQDTEGNSSSKTFDASVTGDSADGAPFLNPVATVQTSVNTPVNVNLTSQDGEGDTVIYSVTPLGSTSFGLSVDSSTGVATVTPPTDFTGQLQFRATVRQTTTATTSSQDDNQIITVQVNQAVPTGVDLVAGSDSGSSDSDDITNATSATFTVSGTTVGATVEIRAGGNVVGSAVATGSTTNVVVDTSSLAQGSVVFTATQRTGSQTSGESPGLSVVLDRDGPAVLGAGALPASTIVSQALAVNLQHGEEGQGLTYSLVSAPAGLTVGATDGQLNWTPGASQLGSQSITLRLTDAAGNTTDQQFTINVIEEPEVRILLAAVDTNGQPITTIATGQEFRIQVTVEDLRDVGAATGVFGAYFDLLFDSNIIEPVSVDPISYVSPYTSGQSGSLDTPGVIDELGAFSSNNSRLGNDLRTLVEVTFRAKAPGNAGLQLESADVTGNDVLLYDQTAAVSESRIEFGSSNFAVGANFELVDDAFNFDEDSSQQSLDVLNNDTTTGGAVLTLVSVGSASEGGTVSVAGNGQTLNYTPAANFNGAEVFTYTARNQDGVESTATVTVQITDVNDAPIALNDTFNVFQNSTNNVLEVLSNDNTGVDDSGAESLTVSAVSSGSAGGTITIGSSGLSINYTPATGFQGTETFTYTLSDGRGGTATGTVTVGVDVENPPPTPQNDNFTLNEDDGDASFDVIANDTNDDPSETLSISSVGQSLRGSSFSVSGDGQSVIYRPAPNFAGTEILTYTLRDSGGAEANALVTFTVNGVNDAPEANNDSLTAFTLDPTTSLDVLGNDVTVDEGETLRITEVTQPLTGNGTFAISSDGLSLIYTPPGQDDFEATMTITYTIDDGTGLTDTAELTLEVVGFELRSFEGSVRLGDTGGIPLSGINLKLTGTDAQGNAISETTTVRKDGTFFFDNQAPGTYTITRDPLPFLNDSGGSIQFASAASDGDMVNELVVSGTLKAQFFGIADFLGSTFNHSLTVAVDSDGNEAWSAAQGEWNELSSLSYALDRTDNTLRVDATDSSQNTLRASLPLSGSRAQLVGEESNLQLLRVRGTPARAGLEPVTGSGEGEGEASGLIGEGEGPAVDIDAGNSVPAIPTITSVRATGESTGERSESLAIRRLLASAGDNGFDSQQLATNAVDEAMESVLPALEVRLSDNLQDALTADDQESLDANDDVIADL